MSLPSLGQPVGQHYPRARVLLAAGLPRETRFAAAGDFVGPVLNGAGIDGAIDISPLCKGVRTVTTLEKPNGTFELKLTFQSVEEAVRGLFGFGFPVETALSKSMNMLAVPENVIDISFDNGRGGQGVIGTILNGVDDGFENVMRGTITKIEEKTTVDESLRVNREIVASGESLGKLLVRHQVAAHKFTAFIQGGTDLLHKEGLAIILNGDIGTIAQRFFDFVFRDELVDEDLFALTLRDHFVIDIEPELKDPNVGFAFLQSVWLRQGKFWNELRGLADEPWNELYADWVPDYIPRDTPPELIGTAAGPTPEPRFVICLRRRPFDEEQWNNLLTHEIADEEIRFRQFSVSDDERVNWVMVKPAGGQSAASDHGIDFVTMLTRRFDQESAEAHGAQLMKRQSSFYDFPSGKGGSAVRDAEEHERLMNRTGVLFANLDIRADKLWRWYSINHRLARGTMIVSGRPEIKIGTRWANQEGPSDFQVDQEYPRLTGYVEQVIHDFSEQGRHFFTHLGVTRCMPLGTFMEPLHNGLDDPDVEAAA